MKKQIKKANNPPTSPVVFGTSVAPGRFVSVTVPLLHPHPEAATSDKGREHINQPFM